MSTANSDQAVLSKQQIRGDRACVKCGFNLFGQIVERESHYNLAIVTCPECNTVASLQTYPAMSRWVDRFRMIMAAMWVLLILFLFALQMSIVGSYADAMAYEASAEFGQEIGKQYSAWAQENGMATIYQNAGGNASAYYKWEQVSLEWASEHVDGIYEGMGEHVKHAFDAIVWNLFPASIAACAFGIFWSTALLGASRKKAVLVPILAAVFVILWMSITNALDDGFSTQIQAQEIAKQYYQPYIAIVGVVFQIPALLFGVYFGRKVARFVLMLTLPPRSRAPFSIFWTRDGLELPKP